MIVRYERVLECFLVACIVMLEQNDGDLHQAFDTDGEVVEDLEQLVAIVERRKLVKSTYRCR